MVWRRRRNWPGKLKAQQDAGRVEIDLVLTGPGALSDGVTQGLWEPILPQHADVLPKLEDIFNPGAKMMQANFGHGQGIGRCLLAVRPAVRICAVARDGGAEDAGRPARLGEGAS